MDAVGWEALVGLVGGLYGAWQRYKRAKAERQAKRTEADLQRIINEARKIRDEQDRAPDLSEQARRARARAKTPPLP